MRGCWEPALLWEMFEQPAPGIAHIINITSTGETQTVLRNSRDGIQEQEFKGGKNLSDFVQAKSLRW